MEHGQAATRTTGLRVLSVLFQIDPSLALATLGPEGAQKLADVAELGEYETVEAQQALVDVLSYACDDKTCRGIVAGQCRQYLLARMRDTASLPMRIAAAIALTKIAQSSANEEHRGIEPAHRAALVEIFCEALRQPTDKWTISARAVEGLTYFSMDPSVKERISQDTRLLKGLSSMATSACETSPSDEQRNATLGNDQGISYGIASILRNITSYPVELTEEQKQLRKLRAMTQSSSARGSQGNGAKGDRPDEESPLDDQAHVERRVTRLLEADLLPTILRLARHTSPTVRESAAHCLHAIVTDKAHRGRMLQHGGARALLALATERIAAASEQATEPKAQPYAAHADIATQALAKLAITVDPRVGFPGELAKELVRPLVRICADAEQPSLRQFECLLALTNLASVAEDGGIAQRIVGEGGVDAASVLQFSRIALVQRAATELICNMMMYPAVAQIYAASQERVKLLVALTDTDDAPTRSAAAGALAILSAHPEGARAILARKQNIARMVGLLEEEDDDGLRHRGAECLRNVAALDKAAAEQVVEAKALLPALVAIIKTSTHPPLVQCAAQVLAVLQQHRLVSI
ncbi:armadillo-type protein [Syncephalis pseudoplumigaleata]|uniref:Armadillo-type protein n=1 Tax=Syncephalis pseudoplumigaleata TaxID=1712513 RepID=A0A4P9YXR5_9FUNG|nr:armadillo-type protein [Syncephalis pseudoplumigaleata]|eukprot:RKP24923.1 armadillo-type protein [Syncephalis pseudoplumigaleata]